MSPHAQVVLQDTSPAIDESYRSNKITIINPDLNLKVTGNAVLNLKQGICRPRDS
jgi:hypothetical protein